MTELLSELSTIWLAPILFIFYTTVSKIFRSLPTLIHKKKKGNFSIFHISHRGGAGEDTENTFESFDNAFKIRTDMYETDVHLTKDGEIVTIHDSSLKRLFNVDKKVHDYDYKDLPTFDKSLDLSFPSKEYTPCHTSFPKKVYLLEKLITQFPPGMINIDIKINNDELIDKVHTLIVQSNRQEYIVWGSFDHAIFKKLKKKDSSIPTFCSFTDALKTILFFNLGLLPFLPIDYDYFEFPLYSIITSPDFNLIPRYGETVNRIRDAIILRIAFNQKMFQHLNDRGIPIFMWVANSEEEFEEAFIRYKANGVMTDFPTQLARYLNKNPALCKNKRYNLKSQDDTNQ